MIMVRRRGYLGCSLALGTLGGRREIRPGLPRNAGDNSTIACLVAPACHDGGGSVRACTAREQAFRRRPQAQPM